MITGKEDARSDCESLFSFLLFRVGTLFNGSVDTRRHYAVEKEKIFIVWQINGSVFGDSPFLIPLVAIVPALVSATY